MRKVMPCSKCGTARLEGKPYILERMPAIFSSQHARLRYKCSCGTTNIVSRQEFQSIPSQGLTVDGK